MPFASETRLSTMVVRLNLWEITLSSLLSSFCQDDRVASQPFSTQSAYRNDTASFPTPTASFALRTGRSAVDAGSSIREIAPFSYMVTITIIKRRTLGPYRPGKPCRDDTPPRFFPAAFPVVREHPDIRVLVPRGGYRFSSYPRVSRNGVDPDADGGEEEAGHASRPSARIGTRGHSMVGRGEGFQPPPDAVCYWKVL